MCCFGRQKWLEIFVPHQRSFDVRNEGSKRQKSHCLQTVDSLMKMRKFKLSDGKTLTKNSSLEGTYKLVFLMFAIFGILLRIADLPDPITRVSGTLGLYRSTYALSKTSVSFVRYESEFKKKKKSWFKAVALRPCYFFVASPWAVHLMAIRGSA